MALIVGDVTSRGAARAALRAIADDAAGFLWRLWPRSSARLDTQWGPELGISDIQSSPSFYVLEPVEDDDAFASRD